VELEAELADRSRSSALLLVALVAAVLPAWAGFDHALEPDLARTFTAIRFVSLVPVLGLLWLLAARPVGRRRPGLLTYLALAVVQVDVAWMSARVDHLEAYLMGFSLAIYGSGALLADRPRWTYALVVTSWAALGIAVLTAPQALALTDLAAAFFYLSTASMAASLAHHRRHQLAMREFTSRVRLEDEQRRTAELLVQLEQLSHEDALTGLANRRRWDVGLAAACAEAARTGEPVSVVLIDVDHFKQVNDRLGHAAGDAALRGLAGLLRDAVRSGDLAARIGGDELAVLLPGAGLDRAVRLAEALRSEAQLLWPEGFDRPGVSVSLGVAASAGPTDPDELLATADTQLYLAKRTRNAVGAPALPTG
jgi:diguanylate cyclase (GGDEF)-like protein